ncbi:MAG: hypothetical protein CMJ89_08560 [Planctomycetes bacterium]|nr:hypothetical protein [Planctomycetota bacterium]
MVPGVNRTSPCNELRSYSIEAVGPKITFWGLRFEAPGSPQILLTGHGRCFSSFQTERMSGGRKNSPV